MPTVHHMRCKDSTSPLQGELGGGLCGAGHPASWKYEWATNEKALDLIKFHGNPINFST